MGEISKKPDKRELVAAIKRWEDASEKSEIADTKLNTLRSQIDDSRLDELIDGVIISKEREDINIIELVARAHEPESWNLDTITGIKNELNRIRKKIFDKLLPVNKRIAELLSGEPSD